jgi:thiol-disulfide isomerase/thioredoxin
MYQCYYCFLIKELSYGLQLFGSFNRKIKNMKSFRFLLALIILNSISFISTAQDSVVSALAKKNMFTFSFDKKSFKGNGWDTVLTKIQKSDFVLIGEDHFTNEIPLFASAVTDKVKFDNFFSEIDPYAAKIIESKIKSLSAPQLHKYHNEFGNVLSFYAFEHEFDLFKQLVKKGTAVYGTDQILMNADRLICSDLKNKTKVVKAKKIYETIEVQSKAYFDFFLKDPSRPMYLMTNEFENQIAELLLLDLSKEEREKIAHMQLSAKIYKEQNHHLRIQLMKKNLMNEYGNWENKKNLFKFGANHMAKGESLLKIYDLGNVVNNIADSKYKNSLHIMIVGKSGTQASPFKGFPEQTIDENSDNLKALKPLFNAVTTDQWHCLDMLPLRNALEEGKLMIHDIELSRIIKGFDYVIIIPKVSAAKFPE